MIPQLMGLSLASGSVLTAQSLEPALDSVSPSLSDTTSLSPEEGSWPEVAPAGISKASVASPRFVLQKPPKSQLFTSLEQE